MTHRLYDMKINRISLVKKPANRRRFVLMKGDEEEELDTIKAVHHHLGGLLDVLGVDTDERKEKIETLIDVFDSDAATDALMRFLNFLRVASEVQSLLASVIKDDEDEEDQDDDDEHDKEYPDAAWWKLMERKIRSLDGPIIVKEGTDMANTVEVDLGGGHVLQAEKSARIRSVVEKALHDAAGVEPDEERRDPRTYSDRLLKAVRNRPEVRALYGLHAELARAASLNGDDPTVEEFLARPRR